VIEYLHEPLGPTAERIARYVARIIDDGSTLQIGLGRVPNEMLRFLGERRDLGIHSDVITEPLVDLVQRGVVTGARKSLHRGQVVASLAMGTRRLYDLIDGDSRFAFLPIEEVANRIVIASNAAMVSVTQAFAIDLTGQVCADSRDGSLYGGVATQPDFHRGAIRSPGGKAIICLASMTPNGDSAIRPVLLPGEAVAIPRAEVHYVVTEYGTAYLFGRSLGERATALIEIAHPEHRERLLAAAVDSGLVPSGQAVRSRSAYPVEEVREATLRDGRRLMVRPTRTSDVPALHELFFRLRPEDVRTRFFRYLRSLTEEMAQHLCSVGYSQEMAFAAVVGDPEAERIVGTSCYFLNPQTGLADVAYMIDPAWHGVGLGSLLQARTIEYARGHGVRGLPALGMSDDDTPGRRHLRGPDAIVSPPARTSALRRARDVDSLATAPSGLSSAAVAAEGPEQLAPIPGGHGMALDPVRRGPAIRGQVRRPEEPVEPGQMHGKVQSTGVTA
jgi:RimJ/RimL family protein N-acetyltransferase